MATLDEFIASLQSLGATLPSQVAREAVPVVQGLIRKTTSAGTDPYGVQWKPNQDGSKPLDGISKYVEVRASGETIKMVLQDPASYHQTGTSKLPKRQIVPDGTLPESWEKPLQDVVERVVANGIALIR